MAKIELAQFDMQQAIAMSPVDSGFIGFAAKSDGLYIRKNGEPEIKILTESDIGSSVQTLTINQLSDLDRTDLDDNYYLVKGFFDGQLFQVTNGNIISQTIVTKDDILRRDIDFTETPVNPVVKSFAVLYIYDNGTKVQLDTVTSEHLEDMIDSSYILTKIYDASHQTPENIAIAGFVTATDTVVLESSISAYQYFAENLEFTKAGELIITATYGAFETILGTSSGAVESVNSIMPDEDGNVVLKLSDIENDSNYVSDSNYVHTDNNYTTTEKNKLANQSGTNSGDETTSTILGKIGDGSKISGNYLPSYVDDVIDGIYINPTTFQVGGLTIAPEDGKIYISTDSNVTYRWSGSVYVAIGSSLALGETSSTAYRGDRGRIAYDHSQAIGNPHNTTASQVGAVALESGKGLINDSMSSRLTYNADEDTISYTRVDGGTREFGKELSDSYTNLDTVTAVNGDIASIIGVSGNRSGFKLTDASDDTLSIATIGMVTVTSIAANNAGEIAKIGKVHGLNTASYSEGTMLYVSQTNKGKWTNIKPTSGRVIQIGIVDVSHAVNGVVDLHINVLPTPTDIGVENGAQVNVVESLSVNGVAVPISGKNLAIITDDTIEYVLVGNVLTFKLSDEFKNLIYAGL